MAINGIQLTTEKVIRMSFFFMFFLLLGCTQSNPGTRIGMSNYFLVDSDDSHVYISHNKDGHWVVVIDQMVVDQKTVGSYAFVLQKVAISHECKSHNGKPVIATKYTNNDAFWIIDLDAEKEMGPFDTHTFSERAKSMIGEVPTLASQRNYLENQIDLREIGTDCVPI